jgi:hypothetical protein
LGGRGRWISEFKASLVYRVSSRPARATQRNPVSKKKKNINKKQQPKKKKKKKTKRLEVSVWCIFFSLVGYTVFFPIFSD